MDRLPKPGDIGEKLLPYAVILAGVGIGGYTVLAGRSFSVNVFLVVFGLAGGIVTYYFIHQSLNQEKNLQFFEGEEIILKSDTNNTYAVVVTMGDDDMPFEPVHSTLYLTNIGILAEKKHSGEASIFVPLDRITEFTPHQGGLRVRYVDERHLFMEVVIFVDDRETWMNTLANILNTRASMANI